MTEREDALGNLARVFSSMASEVYERERKLNQQVRTLKSIGFLLVGPKEEAEEIDAFRTQIDHEL